VTPWDVRVATGSELAELLAADFEAEANRALEGQESFTIGLCGGSVAVRLFPRLALVPLDWSRTEFLWVDERAVPPTDAESNYQVAKSLWLDPANVPRQRIHRMPAEDPDATAAASAYAADLKRVAGTPPKIGYLFLGVGSDGHVASLFPGHPAVSDARGLVAVVEDAPKPPRRRMTLTMPVLAAAKRAVVAAFGRSKAAAISSVIERADSPLPLARVMRGGARVLFLLDHEAASLIG
jgi:6-phosphogluconolactonase